jgi:hypothetical protein
MKEIVLDTGVMSQVSDEDHDYLNQWSWSLLSGYVSCYCPIQKTTLRMARLVFHRMGVAKRDVIDHKDRDKLNNQRSNLRAATFKQSIANRKQRLGHKSRFFGVSWTVRGWMVSVASRRAGPFADEVEAAKFRDRLALEEYGEFAQLNFDPCLDAIQTPII